AVHPKVHLHFTPTYSSWLNQVELWFGKIERDEVVEIIREDNARAAKSSSMNWSTFLFSLCACPRPSQPCPAAKPLDIVGSCWQAEIGPPCLALDPWSSLSLWRRRAQTSRRNQRKASCGSATIGMLSVSSHSRK